MTASNRTFRFDSTSQARTLAPTANKLSNLRVVGWQEQVCLPEISPEPVIGKIDTGAVLSSLHVEQIEYHSSQGDDFVSFLVGSRLKGSGTSDIVTLPLLNFLRVRSSNGLVQCRPIVETTMRLGNVERRIKLTLTDRSKMCFALLLGRDALEENFLVDASRCFLLT